MPRTIDGVVSEVFRMLQEVHLGTVIAIWPDGSVSSHRSLGFRHRVTPDAASPDRTSPGAVR